MGGPAFVIDADAEFNCVNIVADTDGGLAECDLYESDVILDDTCAGDEVVFNSGVGGDVSTSLPGILTVFTVEDVEVLVGEIDYCAFREEAFLALEHPLVTCSLPEVGAAAGEVVEVGVDEDLERSAELIGALRGLEELILEIDVDLILAGCSLEGLAERIVRAYRYECGCGALESGPVCELTVDGDIGVGPFDRLVVLIVLAVVVTVLVTAFATFTIIGPVAMAAIRDKTFFMFLFVS